jgi:hypothetical protein
VDSVKRLVLGDWDESDSAEVVQLEVGEMILVQALPPMPPPLTSQVARVSLFGDGGTLLAVYHVASPNDMQIVFESNVKAYGMSVEWIP